MNQRLHSECSLASAARGSSPRLGGLCLSLLISVSSCGSTDAEGVGASAGAAGTTVMVAGTAGIAANAGAGASDGRGGGGNGQGGGSGNSSNAGGGSAGSAASGGQTATGECTPPPVGSPLQKLSLTGCMNPTSPTQFAERAVLYEVNSPLWSDSADKQRAFVLPPGKTIHVKDCAASAGECLDSADTGKWVFPVGTVMLKNFSFNNKVVETRLFVRNDEETWIGYSYQWDVAQTEATIVADDGLRTMFDTGTGMVPWTYPSRHECMKCHNSAGGFTLGPETRQMNRIVGGTNQIDAIKSKNLFDTPPASPYQAALVPPLDNAPADSAALDKQARSYLHGNCAYCHRPDNFDLGMVNIDLRLDKTLKETKACNAMPVKGDQGAPNATVLSPGSPATSVLWLRMNTLDDQGRMPQIGTYKIHTDAVKLIGDWITGLESCPP